MDEVKLGESKSVKMSHFSSANGKDKVVPGTLSSEWVNTEEVAI